MKTLHLTENPHVTVVLDNQETLNLEANYQVNITIASNEGKAITLVWLDERPDCEDDPTVCIYVGDYEEPWLTLKPREMP